MSSWLGITGTVLGGIIALAGMVWVALIQRRATPYDAIATRVLALEKSDAAKADLITSQGKRLRLLEEDTEVLVDVVAEQHDWQQDGAAPPPPKITTRALAILRRHREERARLTAEPATD